jgi:acetyltransferase-like isoleucine patch superfamily enzyme
MSLLRRLSTRIKRADTPTTAALKSLAKAALAVEVPAPRAVFGPLLEAHQLVGQLRGHAAQVLLFQPMFRARCARVGARLNLYGGLPYVYGDLRLVIGDDCKISAQTSLVAGHVFDEPTLTLGDHTNIGPGVVISVSRRVTLGSHVRVGSGAYIADNPGHPLDASARRARPVAESDVRDVVIEDDAWIGTRAFIMPGVTIGARSVVGAGAVVTRSVPPDTVVAGSPAKIVRRLDEGADVVSLRGELRHG